MLRTKWGIPCVPDPTGHYPDYFEGRDYLGYDDANLEPEPKRDNWPRSPLHHLIRRHKRCRVTKEFEDWCKHKEGENDE